jgi:hypothetical protein
LITLKMKRNASRNKKLLLKVSANYANKYWEIKSRKYKLDKD